MLYKAFPVHQKHQVVQKLPLDEAIELLKAVDAYLKRSTDEVMSLFDKPSKPMGAKGSISSQTQSSFSMILKGLQDLQELVQELNTSYQVRIFTAALLSKWKTSILRTNFLHPYSMLAIWRILSSKASEGLYDGRLITTPTSSRTTLLFLKLHH